ncbi:uncharacterized protein [Primulina eburnea]|uniref:uncharacterized protein n=1 Tax=Primulina eburnea TaxID=1245227 RepID=UPI003C6C96BD
MSTRNPLSIILDQNKLTGPNYHDWFRNLKIVLNSEKIAYVLDKKPPKEAAPDISRTELAKLEIHWDHDLQAKSYMLASMSNELQRRFEEAVNAADIYLHLKELYALQTRSERHATLVGLDLVIPTELSTDILLLSLPASCDGFVVNFNMNKLEATLEELVNMLTNYEATVKKEKHVLLVGFSYDTKKGAPNKGKKRSASPKKKKPNKKPYKKANPGPTKPDKSEHVCFHCKNPGHWRRNCEEYLAQKRSDHVHL